MRYSVRERRFYGKYRGKNVTAPNGYSPNSPGFAERNREQVTELPGGIVRIDRGAPVNPHS